MNDGIVIMNFGGKHMAHFAVCLDSIRDQTDLPVCVLVDDDSHDLSKQFAQRYENVEAIEFKRFQRSQYGNGVGYLNKCLLIDLMPFDRAVFLDCDTVVVSPYINMMLPDDPEETVLTQFADWVTCGNKMRKRLESWRNVEPEIVSEMQKKPVPALNTGVLGLSKGASEFSKDWLETTKKNVRFMCDELAAQIIFPRHKHRIASHYFNCSPIFSPNVNGFDRNQVVVWHGHGFKFIRSTPGLEIFWPRFLKAHNKNPDLVEEAMERNKYFKKLRDDPVLFFKGEKQKGYDPGPLRRTLFGGGHD